MFGSLVFCYNDFFLVRRYFYLCTWYIFQYFVAFMIVWYYSGYFGNSLFSYCISYFGILLVFFLYFVLLYYVLYLVYWYLAILYCIFVYLYEYVFLYLVFGISVLALRLLVFLYVSSSVRARTRYVRTVVMLSWIRGYGRRVL